MTTKILIQDGLLQFDGEGELATVDEYMLADRCVGSIFQALEPNETVELKEGCFQLDEDLDPIVG